MELEIVSKTHGRFLLEFDECDSELVSNHVWHINKCSNKFYAACRVNKVTTRLHNMLMGEWDGHIDHKDGNSLNNRRDNLRKCSHAENLHNIGVTKRNKSGLKGVWFSKLEGKYKSQITTNGKRKCLGTFDTAEEASKVYQNETMIQRGNFARI